MIAKGLPSPKKSVDAIGSDEYWKLRTALNVYRRNAQLRGVEWGLSEDAALLLFRGDCYICGAPPSLHKAPRGGVRRNGIDRIDNDLGYAPGNVASCCAVCNRAKNDMGHQEFDDWLRRAAQHRLRLVDETTVSSYTIE